MKVKAINPLYLDKYYNPGDTVDITDALGQKWIDMGLVEKAEEEKAEEEKPKKTVKKPAKK